MEQGKRKVLAVVRKGRSLSSIPSYRRITSSVAFLALKLVVAQGILLTKALRTDVKRGNIVGITQVEIVVQTQLHNKCLLKVSSFSNLTIYLSLNRK